MSLPDELVEAARRAMEHAHAPYSGFPVGAAVADEQGRVHAGCNVENAAYPEGWCAETSAIAAMVAAGGRRVTEVAVVAGGSTLCTPCGGCRQRLMEFASPETPVHLCDSQGVQRTITLGELLPMSFGPGSLK